MASAKRFYWLKLDQNFFQSIEMKVLKRMAGGPTYIVIYLELLVLSLENNGFIYFEGAGDNLIDELAIKIDEEVKDIQMFFAYAESKGLIKYGDGHDSDANPNDINRNIFQFTRVAEMTGTETDSARRTRRMRERDKMLQIPEIPSNQALEEKASHCDTDVTPMSQDVQKSDTEKELEKEKELDLELEKDLDIESRVKSENVNSSIPTPSEPNQTQSNNNSLTISKNDAFNKLWSLYPNSRKRKELRDSTLAAFNQSLAKGAKLSEIIAGTERYLHFIQERHYKPMYIKSIVNFFNGESWRDSWKVVSDEPQNKNRSSPTPKIPLIKLTKD